MRSLQNLVDKQLIKAVAYFQHSLFSRQASFIPNVSLDQQEKVLLQ